MALNIFPRRTPQAASAPESEPTSLPEPSPEALAGIDTDTETAADTATDAADDARKRTRRGTRGGRGRRKADGAETGETSEAGEAVEATAEDTPAEPVAAEAADEEKPAPRARRSRRTTAAPAADAETAAAVEAHTPEPEPLAEPAPTRSRSRRAPRAQAAEAAEPAPEELLAAPEPAPRPEAPARPETPARREPAPRHEPAARQEPAPRHDGGRSAQDPTAALVRAIEQQNRQIEHLVRAQEELGRKLAAGDGRGSPATSSHARPARVGVFVDSANIELACDRLRARFDWGKVLAMLTKDRQLVRAIAYSPVHDDPNVSIETQRFAEPFLDKGFKLVTKPFKRFADGTIKANVDIEMCLEVVTMLDRLDVVCLVSGDGDFTPLVQYVQSRGVRCEVVAVGQSTAGQLRQAADQYIDLGQRLKEIRV
ncbi:MAG: NYN domain-containing protein [Dehalococcoidia bacterium]|nr:NYN domain-containing protein [Dehalococcoidia bacterium]